MQALPQDGEMVAVFANEAQVTAAIQPMSKRLELLPLTVHISLFLERSGSPGSVAVLKAEGIKTKKLNVSMPSTPP